MAMNSGWRGEPGRHRLAQKGISTGRGKINPQLLNAGIKVFDSNDEYLERVKYFTPNFDEYGREIQLTVMQTRIRDWLLHEIEKEKAEMLRQEEKFLGPEYMARYSKRINKEIDEGFNINFNFGIDEMGSYVEVAVAFDAYDIIYKEDGGPRWKNQTGKFHKRFEKKFGIEFKRLGYGKMRAYYCEINS